MANLENIAKRILAEGEQPGEGLTELVKLFEDMKIPDETIERMVETLGAVEGDAKEIDKTAKALIRHFKRPGGRSE